MNQGKAARLRRGKGTHFFLKRGGEAFKIKTKRTGTAWSFGATHGWRCGTRRSMQPADEASRRSHPAGIRAEFASGQALADHVGKIARLTNGQALTDINPCRTAAGVHRFDGRTLTALFYALGCKHTKTHLSSAARRRCSAGLENGSF